MLQAFLNLFRPQRAKPVIPPLQPKGLAAENYPTHLNFRPEEQSAVAYDALAMLFDNWYGLSHSYSWDYLKLESNQSSGSQRTPFISLSREWLVAETDGCMDFTKLGFYFNGELMFEVMRRHRKITTAHDVHEVFRTELRDLINALILKYEEAKPEMEKKGIYIPGPSPRQRILDGE